MNYTQIITEYLACDVPHSEAFKQGLTAGFRGMHERVAVDCPYKCGTSECDAFFCGSAKGMELYENVRLEMGGY